MNDRLPYADVSIATVLVVVGIALAAYPWLGGAATFSVAAVISVGVVAALAATRRSKDVVSGELPWT